MTESRAGMLKGERDRPDTERLVERVLVFGLSRSEHNRTRGRADLRPLQPEISFLIGA